MTPCNLIERRLLLVSGKGGVGKSTVCAALAIAARRRGLRVRMDEVGRTPPLVVPGVEGAAIDGDSALDEYLGRALPGALHRRLVTSRLYRRFAAGAPGLADLMVLGKLADDARIGGWDLVIADLGATGHALQLLGMPAAADEAFGAGLMRWEVQRLTRELADPAYAALVPVTMPEQLAVDEALELMCSAEALRLALGPLVVNRLHRAPLPPEEIQPPPAGATSLAVEALRRGRSQAERTALDAQELARLGPRARGAVHLPALLVEALGDTELNALADRLEAA